MKFIPTNNGGRLLEGNTKFGDFRVEWDKDGLLISQSITIKTPEPSKGFGDTIKKVTEALGIPQCGGCKQRQDALNNIFPYQSETKT